MSGSAPPGEEAPPAAAGSSGGKGGGWFAAFNAAVKRLKRQVLALHYANQDPRTGWLPRFFILLALAYVLSPVDLIPDFIPVLGLLDDLLILPGLMLLAVRLIPKEVMEDARRRAEHEPLRLHRSWGTAAMVFAMWDGALLWGVWWACSHFGGVALQPYKLWIVAGLGVALAAMEVAWLVVGHRREQQLESVHDAAGVLPELQEALLERGSEGVHAYLEP
ncbi:hypothetical protein C2E20_8713 [Micractinium conductrix]|uniref:DUF1232 domain-containing protein n=1 Tax=Micractinium conductrix TaxID=554055 RepID=A0A2P6V0L5_9CHLO|nr:hypothetical protein C2E20_8713 [Micractinium conductrix]|eukprot:PSC67632.1 hypothetical protein C2E20_8713 [Micractinium conductrix]